MLIINADDWGRSPAETDAALRCYEADRITSVSAMVFMSDSARAAELAKENKIDVGLHLNFTEEFSDSSVSAVVAASQRKIGRFLKRNKYSQLLYNPFLKTPFSDSYQAQAEEFERLFGKPPSHVDGHHHMHLCGNVLLSRMIPAGTKLRRNFSFWPGEKSLLNRGYRGLVDRGLATRYQLADYFFDLTQSINEQKIERVATLAKSGNVELMTHPVVRLEAEYLMGDEFAVMFEGVEKGSYREMKSFSPQPLAELVLEKHRLSG